MNSLTALFSIAVAAFFAALSMRIAMRAMKAENENRILWEQVNNYEAYVKARGVEDEERQRAAARN